MGTAWGCAKGGSGCAQVSGGDKGALNFPEEVEGVVAICYSRLVYLSSGCPFGPTTSTWPVKRSILHANPPSLLTCRS